MVQWNVSNKVLIFQVVGFVSIDNNNVTYSTENILQGAYDPQPIYQQNVVLRYLIDNNSTLPPPNLFNAKGKAIPGIK